MTDVLVIGIDAGGSKTRALVAAPTGEILGWGEAGPANYQAIGHEAAFSALDAAVKAALNSAQSGIEQVLAVCLGAAGMDRPEDFAVFQGWAAHAFSDARARLVNDARLVLAAGTPDGWGLVIISGTGSIAYGMTQQGTVVRSGGWGYLLGDEGSGYDIGLQALRAITRASDGRGKPTAIQAAILKEWGLTKPQELVRRVYAGLPRAQIARLSVIVERCADEGDTKALEILSNAGFELAAAAAAVVTRMGVAGPVPAAFTGGVLVRGTRVREALMSAAQAQDLRLEPVVLVTDPAHGAVRLAIELLK